MTTFLNQPKEVTVEQASEFLEVSPRSVIGYINKKEIKALNKFALLSVGCRIFLWVNGIMKIKVVLGIEYIN